MKSSAILEPMRAPGKRHTQPSARIMGRAAPAQDPFARLDKIILGLLGSGQGPSVTFVYENNETREWAKELHQRMAKIAGSEGVRASWWKIADLCAPGILAGAVSTTVRADLIVVATRAEGLPLPFYVWVNLWWPHRSETPGTLVALLGVTAQTASAAGSVGDYLPIVAQKARMNFLKIEKSVAGNPQPERIPAFSPWNNSNGSPCLNGHHRHD